MNDINIHNYELFLLGKGKEKNNLEYFRTENIKNNFLSKSMGIKSSFIYKNFSFEIFALNV